MDVFKYQIIYIDYLKIILEVMDVGNEHQWLLKILDGRLTGNSVFDGKGWWQLNPLIKL